MSQGMQKTDESKLKCHKLTPKPAVYVVNYDE